MVFQTNETLRIFLWIFVIAGGQFPSFCSAQTAAKYRAEIRNLDQKLFTVEKALADLRTAVAAEKGQKYDQRLSTLEKVGAAPQPNANITDEQRAYLNRVDSLKEKFNSIKEEMALIGERLAGSAMNISYNYFSIFGLIFTLLIALISAAGALGATYIKKTVLDTVKKDVDKQLKEGAKEVDEQLKVGAAKLKEEIGKSVEQEEKEMKVIARFETDLAMADTLFKMSFAWWEQYEEPFRKLLKRRSKTLTGAELLGGLPEPASLELRMARILSERGKKIVTGSSFSGSNPNDNRPWVIRARLMNLWAYHTTAELLCLRGTASTEEKSEILRAADSLIDLAQDERSRKALWSPEAFWYNFHETAAFAMMYLGNEGTQERGRTLIRDLCARKTPGEGFEQPSDEWLTRLRSENEINEQEVVNSTEGISTSLLAGDG
jgi:hypothetical protein